MSEKIRLDRKIRFRNMFYTKCINFIINSIGPSIILRSICIYVHMYICHVLYGGPRGRIADRLKNLSLHLELTNLDFYQFAISDH